MADADELASGTSFAESSSSVLSCCATIGTPDVQRDDDSDVVPGKIYGKFGETVKRVRLERCRQTGPLLRLETSSGSLLSAFP